MNGHRFELLSESNNPEQCDTTMEALRVYVLQNFKHPEDMRTYFTIPITKPYIDLPTHSSANPTKHEIKQLKKEMADAVSRCKTLAKNEKALHQLIMRICSDKVKIRLKGRSHHLEELQRHNCIWLLRSIRAVIPCLDPRLDIFVELHAARVSLYTCRQGSFQSIDHYLEVYKGHIEVIEHYQGMVGESYVHIPATTTTGEQLTIEQRQKQARDYSIAVGFLRGLDPQRYRRLLSDLVNQKHPTDLKSAYELVMNFDPNTNFDP
jgi:hypothetical protein